MFHLIQNASGDSVAQIAVTRDWHQAYCDAHGYTFHVTSEQTPDRFPTWAKIQGLMMVVAGMSDGDRWVCMDTDSVIKRAAGDATLHDVLPDGIELGMVEYWTSNVRKAWNDGVQFDCPHYYNSGVIFGVKSPAVDAMLQAAWTAGTVPEMEHGDEPRLNLLKDTVQFAGIDSRYNTFGSVPPSMQSTIIRSFHGIKNKSVIPGLLFKGMNLADY